MGDKLRVKAGLVRGDNEGGEIKKVLVIKVLVYRMECKYKLSEKRLWKRLCEMRDGSL